MFEIECDWEGLPPIYRVYFCDELFTERTWTWTNAYLQEMLQIEASPGQYRVRLENVGPNLAKFRMKNFQVKTGSARWIDHEWIEISHAG